MNTETMQFENTPMGQHYMIHLQDKDEICLHALSILQAGLIPCFLPIYAGEDLRSLSVDTSGCIALKDISGKYKSYLKKHYRVLLSDFLSDLIHSLDYALSLSGICYSEDQLYFDKRSHRLVCMYLPLRSRIEGKTCLLSSFDENAWEEFLRIPYENKWITSISMDTLYTYFRRNEEASALRFIKKDFWNRSQPLPRKLKRGITAWVLGLFGYLLLSSFLEEQDATALAMLLKVLFLISTIVLLYALFSVSRKNAKKKSELHSEKEDRRKKRNTSMLFPTEREGRDPKALLADLLPQPIQFLCISNTSGKSTCESTFTIWTDHFIVGLDADCCDFSLNDSSLSLTHARFTKDDHGMYVEDLHSKNGTFVNRKRLGKGERVYLQDGDILGLGALEFQSRFIYL